MALDLLTQIQRGNHKSAMQCPDVLDKLNTDDVAHGYSFCLPVAVLPSIDGATVASHGVVHKGTINELRQYIIKHRSTHDHQTLRASPSMTTALWMS
jgi:hypothetical protein